MALYQQKEYDAAVEEMTAAYEERQLPRILLNIGQAYRKMGKSREALTYYERYLKAEPDAPADLKTEIGSYMQQMRTLIDASAPQPAVDKNPPPPVVVSPEPAQVKPVEQHRPIYKKAWFWGVIGGSVAAVAIAVGVGVGVAQSRALPSGIDVIQF